MQNPIQRRDWMRLIFILAIATFTRFYQFGVTEYFHDDAMLATLVQEMATGQRIPNLGILSSTGIPNPPTSVYALLPAFAITLDPVFAIGTVMAFNVMAVGLLWAMVHRYSGRQVALWAALFYALSPWAIFYSRRIWAQDFHTPFILLALLLGLIGFAEGKKRFWAQALCLPILLFGLQIHFAGWALLPLYGLLLWWGRKNVAWRAFAVSLLLSMAVMAPYAVGLWQTLQQDPTRISNALARDNAQARDNRTYPPSVFTILALLGADVGVETTAFPCIGTCESNTLAQFYVQNPSSWPLSIKAILTLVGVLVCIMAQRGIKQDYNARLGPLLGLWVGIPSLLLLPQWTPIYTHYFVAILPAFAWLAGIGLQAIYHALPKMTRPILVSAVLVLLWGQFAYWHGFLLFVNNTPMRYPQTTLPIHYLGSIRQALTSFDNVIVVSDGMAWDLNHDVAVWDTLLKPYGICVRTLKDGYLVSPNRPFTVLITPNGAGQQLVQAYTLYTFQAPPAPPAEITTINSVAFSNGATLDGYAIEDNQIILRWQLREMLRGSDYQYSIKGIGADGGVLQQDGRFLHSMHWCTGDTLYLSVPLPSLATATELQVSLYQLGTLPNTYQNANILDALGNPIGQSAIIVP